MSEAAKTRMSEAYQKIWYFSDSELISSLLKINSTAFKCVCNCCIAPWRSRPQSLTTLFCTDSAMHNVLPVLGCVSSWRAWIIMASRKYPLFVYLWTSDKKGLNSRFLRSQTMASILLFRDWSLSSTRAVKSDRLDLDLCTHSFNNNMHIQVVALEQHWKNFNKLK